MWQWRPQRCGEVPSSLSLLFTNSKLSDANTGGGSQALTGGPQGSQASVLGAPAPKVSSAPEMESCSHG